jgi:hypothetical protein
MINKVKDVMNENNNKQLGYKVWLDELNTAPSEAFFPTFRQFFNLLIKENPAKIAVIRDKVDIETKTLVEVANKAVKELGKLLIVVEAGLEGKKGVDLTQIAHYKQIKSGQIRIMGELLRTDMRKNEKSIGQNKRKLTRRLPNCTMPTRNTIQPQNTC